MTPRPFRFLAGATDAVDGRTLAERARRAEHDAIGLPFDPVGTRVGRLEEAIAVLKSNVMLGELGELDPLVERLAGT